MESSTAEAEYGIHYEARVGSPATLMERVEVVRPQRVRSHHHYRPHVILVLEGVMRERRGSRAMSLEAGTVRVTGAATHDLEFGKPGFRCLVLETEQRWVDQQTGTDDFHLISRDPKAIALVARMQRHLGGTIHGRALLDLDAAELFARLTKRSRRGGGGPPAWLERVRDQVRSSHQFPGLDALAREAGVHPNHVLRAFHDHFGMTIGEVNRRIRVTRAARAIAAGHQSLAEVALTAGYCDQSHLSRSLQKYLGTTPKRLQAESVRSQRRLPNTGGPVRGVKH